MTIKELCNNSERCYQCPFIDICSLNDTIYHLITTNEQYNLMCTNAIIETAKILTGSNINGNKNQENL